MPQIRLVSVGPNLLRWVQNPGSAVGGVVRRPVPRQGCPTQTKEVVMHSLWFHVHVPKAGGSTLRQLMNRSFGKGYYNSVSLLESKQYTCDDVRDIAKSQPWLRCMSDHKLSLDLPYDFDAATVHALAFVREPVDRYVSRYFFHRQADVECAARSSNDFREFVHYELVEGHVEPHVRSQLCFLNQGQSDRDLSLIHSALASERVFLWPVEKFDEAAVCLEMLFPDCFPDLSYVPVNQARRDQQVAAADLELVRQHVSGDLPLYDLSLSELQRWTDHCFASPQHFQAALGDFQARCARRQDNFNPLFLPRMTSGLSAA